MFFVASKVSEFFFAPSHFVIFCALVGALLCFTRYRRFGAWLSLVSALLLIVMGFLPLGSFLIGPLEARFPEQGDDMKARTGSSCSAAPSTRNFPPSAGISSSRKLRSVSPRRSN